MKILVVGGGGREHALAWKLARSPAAEIVYVAPGNAGTAAEPKISNIAIGQDDSDGLLRFARTHAIDLTVIGPEGPLVNGIVDQFAAEGLRCLGPTRAAAQLEGSKAFAKAFLARHGIPTAAYGAFTERDAALAYLRQQTLPIVIKADGLAAGKGVVIAQTPAEAETAITTMLSGEAYGVAGRCVVIEEFLSGEEASFICLADGLSVLPFASSQDHKARDAGDRGPNTGGMGAYSPAPVVDATVYERIMADVIQPTLRGLRDDGIHYRGFLYAGLMIAADGTPKVLEFNCRFGDPETQPILLRLKSDLVEVCRAATAGMLDRHHLDWDPRAAVGVVLAAGGYPAEYERGHAIEGLESGDTDDCKVFHAGTKFQDGRIVTNGGRVLCVCGLGATVTAAQARAYERVRAIRWQGMYYRPDIGYRAIARERV